MDPGARALRLLERIRLKAEAAGGRLHVCRAECPLATDDLVREAPACPHCGEFMLFVQPLELGYSRQRAREARTALREAPPPIPVPPPEIETIDSPRQRDLFG
jgi:hypothetical protein